MDRNKRSPLSHRRHLRDKRAVKSRYRSRERTHSGNGSNKKIKIECPSPIPPSAQHVSERYEEVETRSSEYRSSHRGNNRDRHSRKIKEEFVGRENTSHVRKRNNKDRLPERNEHYFSNSESSLKGSDSEKPIEKEKVNFQPSGKLAEDTNTYKGVVIKYNEPNDAHLPKTYWRLYPFKGEEELPVMHIHRQSAYLIGRDAKIADIPVLHPSCSKQHAVLQYRLVSVDLPDGTAVKKTRPYIIDLNSANGTYLNDERIEPQRFLELRTGDILRFGFSSREYVLIKVEEQSKEKVA